MNNRKLTTLYILPFLIYSVVFFEKAQCQAANTFQKIFGISKASRPTRIISTKDSGYLITGVQTDEFVGNGDGYVLKMNSRGEKQWINGYSRTLADFIIYSGAELPDSSYIVLCDEFENTGIIQRINKDGSLNWQKSYSMPAGSMRFTEIFALNDGSFFACGERNNSPINSIILKFDADGNNVWQKECKHNDDLYNFPGKLFLLGDTLIVCGVVQKPSPPNADTIYLMKMNPANGDFYNAKKIWLGSSKLENYMLLEKSIDSLFLTASFYDQAIGNRTTSIMQLNQNLDITKPVTVTSTTGSIFFIASTLAANRNDLGFAFQDFANNKGMLIKLDGNLDPIFAKTFAQNLNGITTSFFSSMAASIDTGFILGGTKTKIDSVFTYFIKTDKNGQTDSCTTIDVPIATEPLIIGESEFVWGSIDNFVIDIATISQPAINLATSEVISCINLSALPVKLISFTATATKYNCLLQWQTADETNNRGFQIQHSGDGLNYQNIGFVPGKGNSFTNTKYHFTHFSPQPGKNYYRLQQIDIDGQFTYSNVELVYFDLSNVPITIYPNPVGKEMMFNRTFENGTSIEILNTNGQIVEKGTINGNRYFPKKLPAGIYLVMITDKKNSIPFFQTITVL